MDEQIKDASMDAIAGADELRALEHAIASVHTAEDRQDAIVRAAPLLYESAHDAREAGFAKEVDALLNAASEGSTGSVRRAFVMADLAENDREFRRASVDGLDVRRIDLVDFAAEIPGLDLELISTPAGTLLPRSTRPDERVFATIGAEIQLMADNDLPEPQAIELHQRGFDASHLHGKLELYYGLRVSRRLAWGIGFCALTEQRAFGLIFDDEIKGLSRTPEVAAMPTVVLESDGWGSVIVFSARRELFDDHETIAPLIGRSRPYVNLLGSCALALDTYQVVTDANLVVSPSKSEIADAVVRFRSDRPAAAAEPTSAASTPPKPVVERRETPAAATPPSPPAPEPAPPAGPAPVATGRTDRRKLFVGLAVAAAVVAVLVGITLSGGGEEAPRSGPGPESTPASTPTPAEGEEVGEPVVEDAPDGLVTAPDAAETPDADEAAETTEAGSQTVPLGDIVFDVPVREGWSVSDERESNDGRQILRDVHGPDGELIRVIHTPDFEAKPDPSTVVERRALEGAIAADARLMVLEDFPTDECDNRLCDDFVLNDPSFGGVAVLASDSGGTASEIARSVATSVRGAGE